MQTTILGLWLNNPTETGLKYKFNSFNNSYSCLIDGPGNSSQSHNMVFPVSEVFRYENPFFCYYKVRHLSESTESCFMVMKK
jgi:hypothetical protein